jgi:hypothetical protein
MFWAFFDEKNVFSNCESRFWYQDPGSEVFQQRNPGSEKERRDCKPNLQLFVYRSLGLLIMRPTKQNSLVFRTLMRPGLLNSLLSSKLHLLLNNPFFWAISCSEQLKKILGQYSSHVVIHLFPIPW